MAYSLYRDLTLEWRRREEKSKLLHERLELLLLRESEREAARQAEEKTHPTAPDEPEPDPEHADIKEGGGSI
jgi:glycine betaine transporter